jgi:hypothetical protein
MEYPILNYEATSIAKKNTLDANTRHEKKLKSQHKQIFLQDKTKKLEESVQLKTKRKNPEVNSHEEYIQLQKLQEEYIYKQQKNYILEKQELNKYIIYTYDQYKEHIKKKEEYNKKHMKYMEQLKEIKQKIYEQQQQYSLDKQELKKSLKYTYELYKQYKNKEEYNKQIEEYNKQIQEYMKQLNELDQNIHKENKKYTLEKQELNECIFCINEQYTQCKKQIEEYMQQYKEYTQALKELENEKIRLNSLHIKQMIILNNLYLNQQKKTKKYLYF